MKLWFMILQIFLHTSLFFFSFFEKQFLLYRSCKLVYNNQINKTKFWHGTKYIFATSIYKIFFVIKIVVTVTFSFYIIYVKVDIIYVY